MSLRVQNRAIILDCLAFSGPRNGNLKKGVYPVGKIAYSDYDVDFDY